MKSSPQKFRSGGLAAWSMRHPVGVVMISLAVIVLGAFAILRLGVDLLPHIIYPDVRVRVLDPGVPASIMEEQVTRQLEEQLAITEDAIAVQSRTSEGRSAVDLSFAYGTDIDTALRDASTRLDRAKRFLPDSIDPPIIFKRDPSQIPVAEYVISSRNMDSVELREWVDDDLSKWFLNLPGVAAAEVGGGLEREIQVLADQQRLSALGLDIVDLQDALAEGNQEQPGGRLEMDGARLSSRVKGHLESLDAIRELPLSLSDGTVIRLSDVAQVQESHADESLRIRLDEVNGIKLSIQKQPQANTVAVVEEVDKRLEWLQEQKLLPDGVVMKKVSDQAIFVRRALSNASNAALSGALLAMLVVYLFLGNLRRTLIIGSVIPIAIMVTFIIMGLGGLTLNIMTLGGLALGVGMLVDNTIVMMENIARHQQAGEADDEAPVNAAKEVTSAIVAATSTNLAAVLPFLFISGLVGLLFRELIFTISAAIIASLLVALTLVPALSARVSITPRERLKPANGRLIGLLQRLYVGLLGYALNLRWLVILLFIAGLSVTLPQLLNSKQIFLPNLDEGQVDVRLTTDPGINLEQMDQISEQVETLIRQQPEVDSQFATVGGMVFGRSQYEAPNRTSITVQLKSGSDSQAWIKKMKGLLQKLQLVGVKVQLRPRGVRGIRLSQGDDDFSLRIQGNNLETLARLGDEAVARLQSLPMLTNLQHSAEEQLQELALQVDRQRAASLGFSVEEISTALKTALQGVQATTLYRDGRAIGVQLRLPQNLFRTPQELEQILLFSDTHGPTHLGDLVTIRLLPAPATIQRDRQQRIVEISATLAEGATLAEASQAATTALADLQLPNGYHLYDGGGLKAMQESQQLGIYLLGLALFLVLVVMAVQYDSLRNPLIILISVPFATIGVVWIMQAMALPLSMPIWLGLIMLAGIVVNNAIVLVEYIELQRERGESVEASILSAARLRLRPILMTTLTTVVGMLPLALAWGEGAEMLRPLALTIVAGLSFSMLVSLFLVPAIYRVLSR